MTRNNGDLAIVMEFLPLGSLKVKRLNEMWAKSGASENEIFRKRKCFVLGLISGLDYLHNKKIVHRDLKTANILCAGDEPVPKIADFGLAKVSSIL